MQLRRTVIVHGRLAIHEMRLAAAHEHAHGTQILTTEQMVARLAGGFLQGIDHEALQEAVRASIDEDLGEIDAIKHLPGMMRAAVSTLEKVWRAGIDLEARSSKHSRLAALHRLERAVLQRLPPQMLRPRALAEQAAARLAHAPQVLGPVTVRGITEMAPCWRPLVFALAEVVPVIWEAGPREIPAWLEGRKIEIRRSEATAPGTEAVSCANARHEALEALRWARELMASGRARPEEIAIAAASPTDYDDHLITLAADANLDLHFVHGRRAVATRDGQACAALAEVLLRGLSHDRVQRLFALLRSQVPELEELPADWVRVMPEDGPLLSLNRWQQLFTRLKAADWPDGIDRAPLILPILDLLAGGPAAAEEAGERLLSKMARAVWTKALQEGPSAALDVTLADLRIADDLEPASTIVWMPAAALAASPRRFANLLGLSSRAWPRGITEDALLPDHVVPLGELDPLPVAEADRRDFRTILSTTGVQLRLSRPRRDTGGRQLGKSPLIDRSVAEIYLRQSRVPQHAASESDRLLSRTSEFAALPVAASALACWHDWHRNDLTSRDGLMRPDHPVIARVLMQPQSATSLRLLLRDPLGYLWRYALGWTAPSVGEEPIILDALAFGNLVHEILERAVVWLEGAGGLGPADEAAVRAAVADARTEVARRWEEDLPIPPTIIWRRTLVEAAVLSVNALTFEQPGLDAQQSWAEVAFGDARADSGGLPWDPGQPIEIAGTGLSISGKIDRLDLSADRSRARVTDYKTGRVPKDIEQMVLKGGKELQRCLYGYAVMANLGEGVAVDAALVYPRHGGGVFPLADAEQALQQLAHYLALARGNLLAGLALPGEDAKSEYNEFAFALPGNAKAVYCEKKLPLARDRLGEAVRVWDLP